MGHMMMPIQAPCETPERQYPCGFQLCLTPQFTHSIPRSFPNEFGAISNESNNENQKDKRQYDLIYLHDNIGHPNLGIHITPRFEYSHHERKSNEAQFRK